MKIASLALIALALCGCSRSDNAPKWIATSTDTKFAFGDRVKINKGFYRGTEAVVIGHIPYGNSYVVSGLNLRNPVVEYKWDVDFMRAVPVIDGDSKYEVSESQLELVKAEIPEITSPKRWKT